MPAMLSLRRHAMSRVTLRQLRHYADTLIITMLRRFHATWLLPLPLHTSCRYARHASHARCCHMRHLPALFAASALSAMLRYAHAAALAAITRGYADIFCQRLLPMPPRLRCSFIFAADAAF